MHNKFKKVSKNLRNGAKKKQIFKFIFMETRFRIFERNLIKAKRLHIQNRLRRSKIFKALSIQFSK